jgi:plastocyanin
MHRYRRRVAALLAVLFAEGAFAGMVTVNVTARSGVVAADTVIVFDPLDATPAPSHDAAIIDQINKRFVPRVSVVRTGTTITFPNSDRIRHQVYSFSQAKTFDLKLYAGSPKTPVEFDRPGLVVLGCNIHDTMVAFVGVVDSPYFAKTSESGSAVLNLPAGRYRLRAWHPNAIAAIPAREITVAAAPLSIPLAIDVDEASTTVAAWPE